MKDETKGTIKFIIGIVCILLIVAVIVEVTDSRPSSKDKADTTTITTIEDITTENIQQEGGEKLILPIGVEGIENAETDYLVGDIEIPRVLEPDENGVIVVTMPATLLNQDVETSDEKARVAVESLLSRGITVVDAYGNDDGSVTFIYDEENWELYMLDQEIFFCFLMERLNCYVSISKDFRNLIIYIDEETHPLDFGSDAVKMGVAMLGARIYTGVPYDEVYTKMTVVYEKTGEVMLEHTFNGESFTITDEDWNAMFENLE